MQINLAHAIIKSRTLQKCQAKALRWVGQSGLCLQGHYLIRGSFHSRRARCRQSGRAGGVTQRPPSLAQSSRCRELGLIWSVTLAPRPYRRRRPRPIIAGPASPPDYRVGCDSVRHVARPLLPRGRRRRHRLHALQWVPNSYFLQLQQLFQQFS